MTTEEIDYISKNLFLKQFESEDTSDYIKSKVNLCADEMIKKIVTCEEDRRNNRSEFEKAIHSKIALSEHTNISFRIDLEKLNTKMIQDISSLQNTMIELKKQLEFNILSVSKIQTFQSRENEIIISIQCRLDLIESGYNNEKNLSKKINTLESKLNAQCLKTKNLETIVKGELRKEISNTLIPKATKVYLIFEKLLIKILDLIISLNTTEVGSFSRLIILISRKALNKMLVKSR